MVGASRIAANGVYDMRKTLTAGLTALSLILIPAAPVHAENNTALNQAILGLLAAGAIGLAINKNRRDQSPSVAVEQNQRFGDDVDDRRRDHAHNSDRNDRDTRRDRHADPLPGRCFRRVELGNGRVQNVFAARCLDRRYSDAATLPRQCLTRIGGRDGSRRGYEARCLRDFGYRSDRRW
jgi:hypothetical protein